MGFLSKEKRDVPAIVYMAVNTINGKKYIGVTSKPLSHRKNGHRSAAKRGLRGYFYQAIRKYGFDVFSWSILKMCPTFQEAFEEEIRLISLLGAEYNVTKGGTGNLGRILTEEQRAAISVRHKGNKYRLGQKQPQYAVEKSREYGLLHKDKWLKNYQYLGPMSLRRKVICLDDGTVFESASAAAEFYGCALSALIELCLGQRGRKTVNGRRFMYYVGKEVA